MSYWNHRIIKKVYESGEIQLGVHEVFYNDDGTIYGFTEDPADASVFGTEDDDLLADLRQYLGWMTKALDKPILVDDEVETVPDPLEAQIDEIMKLDNLADIEKALEELDANHN